MKLLHLGAVPKSQSIKLYFIFSDPDRKRRVLKQVKERNKLNRKEIKGGTLVEGSWRLRRK